MMTSDSEKSTNQPKPTKYLQVLFQRKKDHFYVFNIGNPSVFYSFKSSCEIHHKTEQNRSVNKKRAKFDNKIPKPPVTHKNAKFKKLLLLFLSLKKLFLHPFSPKIYKTLSSIYKVFFYIVHNVYDICIHNITLHICCPL